MKFDSQKNTVKFSVEGKPPRKSSWGNEDAHLVLRFREETLKARTRAGLSQCFNCPVKLKLTVFAPNITNINYKQEGDNDPKRYVGDLDAYVSGVCEYLQRAPKNPELNIDPILKERNDIGPDIDLIIENDSQIVSIVAEKIKDDALHYEVEIEPRV